MANYIQTLQDEIARKDGAIVAGLDGIDWLLTYLASSKFRCGDRLEGYVNVNDVAVAARDIRASLSGGR